MGKIGFKKGQLSIETMILYGLIALVALAAVAALIYFDVLNLGSYLPDKCDVGGSGDLNCEEIRVVSQTADPAGLTIELGVRNVGQRAIDSVQVCIQGEAYMTTQRCGQLIVSGSGNTIPNGELAKVTINEPSLTNVKGSMNAKLTVTYKYVGGVVDQAAIGTLRAKITNLN
jgi:hypothetical protein